MMKLHKEGVYLVEGAQLVPRFPAPGASAPANVTPQAAKKATIAPPGILQAHNQSGDPNARKSVLTPWLPTISPM